MSIVLELQKNILKKEKNTTELLRQALYIASKLNLLDFKTWITNELKGYPDLNIPKYREIKTSLKFYNPYRGWIPGLVDSEVLSNTFNTMPLRQSISEIEDLMATNSDNFELSIADTLKKKLMETYRTDCNPALFINKAQIVGIVEQVKTTLLEWVLQLESEGILGDNDMSFTINEREKAQHIHIGTFNGVMGSVENIGNLSTGDHAQNTSNISILENKIDALIEQIRNLPMNDKDSIIQQLNLNKSDSNKLLPILGELMTRGAEISTILPFIVDIMGSLKLN